MYVCMYIYLFIYTHIYVYIGLYAFVISFNPLNANLDPICHLLALLGARHILHIGRIWVKLSTKRYFIPVINSHC